MFITLIAVNLVLAFVVCFVVVLIFRKPISKILLRLVSEDIYTTWAKYILFATYVVGISGGVRIWDLEKYISPQTSTGKVVELTNDRWVLEVYATIIGTLQSIAWMLLLFFIFALLAYVVVKGLELRKQQKS